MLRKKRWDVGDRVVNSVKIARYPSMSVKVKATEVFQNINSSFFHIAHFFFFLFQPKRIFIYIKILSSLSRSHRRRDGRRSTRY